MRENIKSIRRRSRGRKTARSVQLEGRRLAVTDIEIKSLLRSGVMTWNAWRDANTGTVPQLAGLDLHGTTVTFQDNGDGSSTPTFTSNGPLTSFSGYDLRGADLSRANLMTVDLTSADLTGAKLDGAILFMADPRRAKLDHASGRYANLEYAKLTDASLIESNFSGSRCAFASFAAGSNPVVPTISINPERLPVWRPFAFVIDPE